VFRISKPKFLLGSVVYMCVYKESYREVKYSNVGEYDCGEEAEH
jgi:hypothetical protein